MNVLYTLFGKQWKGRDICIKKTMDLFQLCPLLYFKKRNERFHPFMRKIETGPMLKKKSMNSEILIALIGAVSAAVTGLFTRFITQQQSRAATTSVEIDNVRKSNEMLSERVTELNDETKVLRKETMRMGRQISHLRRAIERIPQCVHATECPVSGELQNFPPDNDHHPQQ